MALSCLPRPASLQARALQATILQLSLTRGDPLFVVSPLSRALETFLELLPQPQRLAATARALEDAAAAAVGAGASPAGAARGRRALQPVQPRATAAATRPAGPGGAAARASQAELAGSPLEVLVCE